VFVGRMRTLFETSTWRFSMLGNALFWASAAVLRLLLVAWAPVVLLTATASDVADLTLFLALGIVVGALLVPHLIPIERLRRARLAAYAMGVSILVFSLVGSAWPARAVLFAIGVCGGMFLVPINAALQNIGHRTIGSGRAVALQSFFENSAMLTGVAIYTAAVGAGAQPVRSIVVVGVLVLIATTLVSWRLPPDPVGNSGDPDPDPAPSAP
jgi:LPLT family lysophospholipid transporter-like MFS transporter